MSTDSSNFERRQHALEAVRRHVRRLEIETHRVKAHLARLEAEYEDDAANQLTRMLSRKSTIKNRIDAPHLDGVPAPASERAKPNVLPFDGSAAVDSPPRAKGASKKSVTEVDGQKGDKPLLSVPEPPPAAANRSKSRCS